jgi:Protein trafficking PGA2
VTSVIIIQQRRPYHRSIMSSFKPEDIPALLSTWANNFTTQTRSSFARLTLKDWIRIIAAVGAYMLLIRPFLVRIGQRIQAKQHAEASAEEPAVGTIDPRTGVPRKFAIPGVDSDSDEEIEGAKANPTTGEWGRKARLRQRRTVRKIAEMKEEHLLQDDDDDIKEFLDQ